MNTEFQKRVDHFVRACFNDEVARDKVERNHRFGEESLELLQACGCSKDEMLQLIEYVFSRPVGEIKQELGGTMVTLAALCNAHDLDMCSDGNKGLEEAWVNIKKIQAKHLTKPKFGPLPQ